MNIQWVNSANSSVTIETMRTTFAFDNGSKFASSEFKSTEQKKGIKHSTLHPIIQLRKASCNGLVWTFRQGMQKQGDDTIKTSYLGFF